MRHLNKLLFRKGWPTHKFDSSIHMVSVVSCKLCVSYSGGPGFWFSYQISFMRSHLESDTSDYW